MTITFVSATPPGPALVEATLEHDRVATFHAMLRYLPTEHPQRELYGLAADYPLRLGKGMRPSLCLAACRAFGGSTADAVDSAAALELLHNAFLVHDDIEDGSRARRGRPTLHALHGLPLAINAGDALTVLSQAPLLANVRTLGHRLALAVMAEFQHLGLRTIEGQATELMWRRTGRSDLTPADYLALVLNKTCWYSAIHPLRIGALIGSRRMLDLDRFDRFGFFLGATFQIHDDLENLDDRTVGYGKDWGGDVIEGKPTLPLIHLLGVGDDSVRSAVLDVIGGNGDHDPGAPARVIELMRAHGSLEFARTFAEALAGAALAEFEHAFSGAPVEEDANYIRALALHLRDPAVGWRSRSIADQAGAEPGTG
jgi:geranylgeranyl diphosphate synthase type II